MSFAALLVHQLALVVPATTGLDDEYGHPEAADPTVTLLRGMAQPRTAREVALMSQAGAEISDWVIFLEPRDIPAGAWITDADDTGILAGGRRFDIRGVRPHEYGSVPHLELDCRLVGSTETPEAGS